MDKALDSLSHKRGSVREEALCSIITGSTVKVQVQFAEKNFVTLVYRSLALLKKGSPKEVSLATQAIALFAITLGPGGNTHEIYKDSLPPLSQALESGSELSKISSILDCLAIVTFVGAKDFEETEKSMQIIWKLIQPVALNGNARKHSPAILAAAISAWSFILTTVDGWRLNYKYCRGAISYLSDLIEYDDESVCIAALEALALIFESGCFNSLSTEAKCSSSCLIHEGNTSTNGYSPIQEMKDNILHRVRRLSLKDEVDKDRMSDWLKVFEDGCCPKTLVINWQNMLKSFAWYRLLQIKFMKRILGSGFNKHMQENEFLHELFEIVTPKREDVSGYGCQLYELDSKEVIAEYYEPELRKNNKSSIQRMFMSPNSFHNKAMTQLLNKRRMLSQKRRNGHYVVDDEC